MYTGGSPTPGRPVRIAVLTGAGMSAESGVPTFRDALTGLWERFDPEQLATERAFRRDPALVWGWYRWRARLVAGAQPHAGHRALAALADAGHAIQVITQNVDNLHERAGSRDVLHLHGSLFSSRCLDCGRAPASEPILERPHAIPADGGHETPPACAHCGAAIRPGVVWFGEPLPAAPWEAAQAAIRACQLLVVVGTSGLVQPAASLPLLARGPSQRVIEINPVASAITELADEHWPLPASTGLARLASQLSASA